MAKASNGHWQIVISRKAERILKRLPKNVRQRLQEAIDGLAANPHPTGSIKLSRHENLFRIRVGDWRIIYAIENDKLVILVTKVSPWGGAYRNL